MSGKNADVHGYVTPQRKGSSTMVIRLAQANFPDALGMEMKEIRIPSARTNAGALQVLYINVTGCHTIPLTVRLNPQYGSTMCRRDRLPNA